jgi:Gram-negative porin
MRWIASVAVVASLATGPLAEAQVNLNVYGDVDYTVAQTDEPGNPSKPVQNSFAAPRIELFPTATQDRLSFLSEVMFEVDEENNYKVDIERIEVAYLFSDYFRLKLGRFHTAMGYYNDAYHHGLYFQIATDRPEMVRFEDEGGLIPAHSVGVHIDGLLPLGPIGAVRYDMDGANGRGLNAAEITNAIDHNNQKAFNLRLRLEPSFPDGLVIGGNFYIDTIRASTTADPMSEQVDVDEVILGAHLAYLENYVHLIAEYLRITHKFSGRTGVTEAAYVELGYTFGLVTPYVRLQQVTFPPAANIDPFYAQNVLVARGSFKAGNVGLRFNVSDYLALKLEGGYTKLDAGTSIKTGAVQCAFAF